MNDKDKKYLTANRLEEVKKELEELKGEKRKDIARRIEDAKNLGDLSENAEYAEAREEQAFNEGKIKELENLIRNAEVIKENNSRKSVVKVGDSVEVKDSKGNKHTFTIVGSNEADPLNDKISNESPLGKSFLGKNKGDKISTNTPLGEARYKIIKIR